MTAIRVKGFQIFPDRHGKMRCYHRATCLPIDLTKYPLGSVGFFAEVVRIGAGLSVKDSTPGTLGSLFGRWRASPAWAGLSDRTRKDYERVEGFLEPIRDEPLSRFTPPFVVKVRDRIGEKHGNRWGTYAKQVLSSLFSWAVERGYMPTNPAKGLRALPKPKDAPEANRPWTDEEREAVMAGLPSHLAVPIALCAFLGLDPQDACALRKEAMQDGRVLIRRGKTGRAGDAYHVPILAPLAAILAAAPAHDAPTVAANSRGEPWTVSGLNSSWAKERAKLGFGPGLTLKGLRHTLGGLAMEAGVDTSGIAAVLHHKTEAMARHYSRRGDRTRRATAAFEAVGEELARRSLSNRSETSNSEGRGGGLSP